MTILNMQTLKPNFKHKNQHDDLFYKIKRRIEHGELLQRIASDYGIAMSTASAILHRNGTSVDEIKNSVSSR